VSDRAPPRQARNTDFIHRGWRSPAIMTLRCITGCCRPKSTSARP